MTVMLTDFHRSKRCKNGRKVHEAYPGSIITKAPEVHKH